MILSSWWLYGRLLLMSNVLFPLACEMEISQTECGKHLLTTSLRRRNAKEAHFHSTHSRPSRTMMQTTTLFPQSHFPVPPHPSTHTHKREFPDALLSSLLPLSSPLSVITQSYWSADQVCGSQSQGAQQHAHGPMGRTFLFLIIKVLFKNEPSASVVAQSVQRGE